MVNLDPAIGAEIKKTRPAIIVNADGLGKLPLRVIVPITDWKDHYAIAEWMVKLTPDSSNNLSKISSADCFQVRSVSTARLIKQIGTLTDREIKLIELALGKALRI